MSNYKLLFKEENAISLRTAQVSDNGDLVIFRLEPLWMQSAIPGSMPRGTDWVHQDSVWLYRHLRSASDEAKLFRGIPCIQRHIRAKKTASEFRILWSDSGHTAAIYIDGELWAFVDERTHRGYSKGILTKLSPKSMSYEWNQELFEELFFK